MEPHKAARAVHVRDRGGHVTRLNGQAWHPWARGGQEAYGKFAYSSLAGFSHATPGPGLEFAVPDGALMLSEDGRHWRGREDSDEGSIDANGVLTIAWQPWEDVTVTTSLEAGRGRLARASPRDRDRADPAHGGGRLVRVPCPGTSPRSRSRK